MRRFTHSSRMVLHDCKFQASLHLSNRGQSYTNMSVVTPSSLMVFYTSMNLTCTGLGVRVPTSSRVSTPSMVIFHNSM